LLQNAAKFTPARGSVRISTQRHSDQATVRVHDSGVGISSEILPYVFDMFVQADRSVARAHGGLGIGLSLVKRLIDLHGGDVEAFSAGVGQGSEFVVRLPLRMRVPQPDFIPPRPVQPNRSEARGPARRTVMVVDDNVDAAATLARLLSTSGHDVLVAHDGRSGIELGKTRELDAIVMDLGMPGMSGYSAARLIRADPQLSNVLLIALTGWHQEEARLESTEAGFDHHLVKPVELAVLEDVLMRPKPRRPS
jgi:CheY-like chemotaxis protein